jgi:hypothetical protein
MGSPQCSRCGKRRSQNARSMIDADSARGKQAVRGDAGTLPYEFRHIVIACSRRASPESDV